MLTYESIVYTIFEIIPHIFFFYLIVKDSAHNKGKTIEDIF